MNMEKIRKINEGNNVYSENLDDLNTKGLVEYIENLDFSAESNDKLKILSHALIDNIADNNYLNEEEKEFGFLNEKRVQDFESLKEVIRSKLDNPGNNYFYNAYYKKLIDDKDFVNFEGSQIVKPFDVNKGEYVASANGKLYRLNENQRQDLKKYDGDDSDFVELNNSSLLSKEEFFSKKNIPNDNEWSNLCEDYVFVMETGLKNLIENDFSINISDLSLKEQFNFLLLLKRKNIVESKRLIEFTNEFKKNAFKVFLSVEHGGKEMGDKILTLGEKLPKESAELLFKKYSEIIDAVDSVENLLREELGDEATPEILDSAKERLLIQGKNLLEEYAKDADKCTDKECEDLGRELNEKLAFAKESVFAFSSACRTLVEMGKFSFEDFKKAELIYDKSPLLEKMKEEIIAMHKENTKQYPEGLRGYWRGTLKEGLEKENSKQMVVSVRYEDTVVSTMRVIEQEDGSWYGASFNVNPNIMGSRIGTELLKEVINNLAKDKPFIADCYAENPMLKTYTEKFGFKITDTYEDYHDTGAKVHQITLFPEGAKSST